MVEKQFGVCDRDGKRCLGHRKYCHVSGRSDFVTTNYGCEEYIPDEGFVWFTDFWEVS